MDYKTNCKTCQLSAQDEALQTRIWKAKFDRQPGEETMSDLAAGLKVSWPAFSNHCNKHIHALDNTTKPEVYGNSTVAKIEEVVSNEMLVAESDYERGLRVVIASGLLRLAKGDISVSTSQLINAIKIKADYVSKKRGQDTEVIKMVYRMASTGKIADGTKQTDAAVDSGRENRPSDLHNPLAGYAIARRPETVPAGDSSAQDED